MKDYPDYPITRKEKYLAKIGGEDVAVPTPITRIEMYLNAIAENGGGGGGGSILVVNGSYDEQTDITTLDKTWQEIHDAALIGSVIIRIIAGATIMFEPVLVVDSNEGYNIAAVSISGGFSSYVTDSASGYPSSGQ